MTEAFRILTVDDNEVVSAMLSIILTNAGFTVCSTSSGGEAILALEAQAFDLMLIDISMPDMDGLTLLEDLRADGRFVSLPALMLTAYDDIAEIKRARALGARGYLTKPFDERVLADKARRVLLSPEIAWIDDHHCLLQPAAPFVGMWREPRSALPN